VVGSLGEGAKKLSAAGRKAANDQVAAVAHGLLDLDLGGLVIAAWGKWADLTAAAKRTFATQDSSEVVELAVHTITSTHRPFVELLVNDVHVATVRFELAVKFVIKGLVATVQHGRLVAVHAGDCERPRWRPRAGSWPSGRRICNCQYWCAWAAVSRCCTILRPRRCRCPCSPTNDQPYRLLRQSACLWP
jgi:hypothetical protein